MTVGKFRATGAAWCAIAALAACGGEKHGATRGAAVDSSVPGRAATIDGFKTPESVRYDSALDVYFVSNINGDPTAKDGNGFISRVRPDGSIDSLMFIAGGRGGVTLNAPKGLALIADTLWVADLDAVRGFDVRTGALVANVDLSGQKALFLNDICVGPDGALYVTDTGVRGAGGKMTHVAGADRIFRIAPDRSVSVALATDSLESPNGITWDRGGRRFIVVPFNGSRRILAWRVGEKQPTQIGFGRGQFDGVELLPDDRLVVTSWADSSISIRDGARETIIRNVPSPADIGIDTKRMRIAVPELTKDRIELFTIPARQPAQP
jgi:sugar lactone lactonase YvrE